MPVNFTRFHKPDYTLIGTIGIIFVFGLMMLFSASSYLSYQNYHLTYYYLLHQILFGVIPGLVLFFIALKIDYHQWKKLSLILLVFSLLLLVAVFIPKLRCDLCKARSWISLGIFSFQPSEIVKLTFILYLASLLEKKRKDVSDFYLGLLPFIVLTGLISFLIILQPDFGTLSIIVLTSLVVYFFAGAKIIHLISVGIVGCSSLFLLIKIASYRMARLLAFLYPASDPQGIGYHINQALLAVGSGGILGVGLGQSKQKFAYLPQSYGDSIFAVIAEELGFIACVCLVILFLFLLYRGFKMARNAPDLFGKLVACGITFWFVFQAMVNIMSMLNLLPITGLPLPFISYGGTAMAISLFAFGILVNISKQTRE